MMSGLLNIRTFFVTMIILPVLMMVSLFAVPAEAVHNQLGPGHPLYETCKTHNPVPAACADANQGGAQNRIFGSDGIFTKIAQIITILTGVVAVIAIVVSGIYYITSAGNPEKTKKAKDIILYAIVGLVVAAIGQAIILFVLEKL